MLDTGITAVPAIFAQLVGDLQGWAVPDEGQGGLEMEGVLGVVGTEGGCSLGGAVERGKVAIFCL